MRSFIVCLVCVVFAVSAPLSGADSRTISLGEAAEHAVRQSKLILPGSQPFHLKAKLVETTNPQSEYQAELEEYWVAPDKWRRIVQSPEFSQTLVVNGDKVEESDKGNYLPWWLNDLMTAMVDPLPMLESLKPLHVQVQAPTGSQLSTACSSLQTKIDRWMFCFTGNGLVKTVMGRGYSADFDEFKSFGDKRVARKVKIDPEPGTTIEASITELSKLDRVDETLFAIGQVTPREDRIRSTRIDEETLRKLAVNTTEVDWPPVGGGMATGRCAVYVSADRSGHMREVWPKGCDNPGLQDPLREIVQKWQLKPAKIDGTPTQVEALLTFEFATRLVKDPTPELSDAEVRKLATNAVEPGFPSGSVRHGDDVIVRISVDESGKLTGVQNNHNLSTPVFMAIYGVIRNQWKFRPYIKEGKPQYFHGEVVFHVR